MSTRNPTKYYTKEEIRKIIDLWETSSVSQIAEELNRTAASVMYVAKKIRDKGYALPKKIVTGKIQTLINEVLEEKGFKSRN